MSSPIPFLGREVTVEALGRTWIVGRMDLDIIDRFLDWLRPQLPDPFEGLKDLIAHLPPENAMALIKEAQQKRACLDDYDSPMIEKALSTKRGQVNLFLYLLQIHQPEATLTDAAAVMREIGPVKMAQVFDSSRGSNPGGKGWTPDLRPDPGSELTGVKSSGI